MQDKQDSFKQFSSIVTGYFEKVKKNLPKKYTSFKDFVTKMENLLKTENQVTLGKYYSVIKFVINMRNIRLSEITLNALTRLVSQNFIDGRSEDLSHEYQLDEFPELMESPQKSGTKMLLIDSLVYSVSSCLIEKEEVVLISLKLLIAFATNARCNCQGSSLVRILRTIIYVYSQSKSPSIDRVAKTGLLQIIHLSFQAVEQDIALHQVKSKRLRDHFLEDTNTREREGVSPKIKQGSKRPDSIDYLLKENHQSPAIDLSHKKKLNQQDRTPYTKLCGQILTQIVDDVQLYNARVQKVVADQSIDVAEIPLRAVPYVFTSNDSRYQRIVKVDVLNERDIPTGRFGWCIDCRGTADLYCKDHRVPICSYKCKRSHAEFLDWAQRLFENTQKWHRESIESALLSFESLCKLLGNSSSMANQKHQLILLELVLCVVENPDKALTNNNNFLRVVREILCSQLLKYCLETEKTIFHFSFKIFLRLFYSFRRELKHEIGIFIDQIFLKILESTNCSFPHRQIALEVLMKMFERPKTALEFYVNFDCSLDHVCLLAKIVTQLSQIIEGLYTKPEFQAVVNIQQEAQLRLIAAQTITYISNGLQETFDQLNPIKDEAVAKQAEDDEDIENIHKEQVFEEIEKQRMMKIEFKKGIELLNENPDKGIKYLLKAQLITENPVEIASFLKNNQDVTKDAIGGFIKGEKPLNQSVLQEFTNLISMKNMTVEMAIRTYLDQFTLSGEAQQVDRIIQRFAHKYFQDNQNGRMKTSDSVYTFAYLLIIVQTDLHNPRVEDKMKFQDFTKLAKGINDGEDLPADHLQTIFNNIQKKPLAIHEKSQQKVGKELIASSERKKQELFQKEQQQLVKKGNELLKSKGSTSYVKVNSIYYIKMLLEVVGGEVFQSLSTSFLWDLASDHHLTQLIINSIFSLLRLYSFFQISMDQIMEIVVKLSGVMGHIGNQQAQPKQYTLIHQLLYVVPSIGNGLKIGGWKPIFQLISRLDELKQFKSEELFQFLDLESSEKVFMKSKNLDSDAILDFISALCQVSKQELSNPANPRLYSLQKLVEVSDYNMDRIRIIWSKMWSLVRDHFSEVGTRSNTKISVFAVEQLKQLSVKFLQKEELSSFTFQREFLKPFETIFTNVDNEEIKDYILQCMHSIVLNYKNNIKSGWRVIFDLINFGLQEESDKISRQAFQILVRIMNHDLDMIQDVFVDLIQSLGKLGRKKQEDLALASVELVKQCLNYLSAQASIQPRMNWNEEDQTLPTDSNNQFTVAQLENYWVPLLGQLSNLAGDQRESIQETSMDSLFTLLNQYGYAFSTEFWKIVFQVVLRPLFDEIQYTFQLRNNQKLVDNESSQKDNNWFKTSCQKGFNYITNLVNQYFHKLRELLPDFLKLFENCIQNQNELLAKYALSAVKNTVLKLGKKFSDDEWNEVILFCERMFKATTPSKLLQVSIQELNDNLLKKSKTKLKLNTEEAYTQCVSQLLLIQVTKDLIENYAGKLTIRSLTRLDVCVSNSQQFAKEFNQSVGLRYLLWRNGFMVDMKQLPGLLRQEREAQSCTFMLKYEIYKKMSDPQQKEQQLKDYKGLLVDCLQQFVQKHKEYYSNVQQKPDPKEQLQKSKSNSLRSLNDQDDEEEKSINREIRKLNLQEIEREATNSRTLLDQTILPKLLQLEDCELISSVSQFHTLLLESLQYICERGFTQSTCADCKSCERCLQFQKDNLEPQFKAALKRLFEIALNK